MLSWRLQIPLGNLIGYRKIRILARRWSSIQLVPLAGMQRVRQQIASGRCQKQAGKNHDEQCF